MGEECVEVSLHPQRPGWSDEHLTITRDYVRKSTASETGEIDRSRVRRILLMTLEQPAPRHLPHAIRIDNRWFSPWFVASLDATAFRKIQAALDRFDWTMVRERDVKVRKFVIH